MSWIFVVVAHWNNCQRVNMSLQLDTLFWFQANQSLLLLLSAACLVEKNKYQFYSLWLDPTRAQFTIYHTQAEHANHYTTDVVSRILEVAILDYKIFLLDQSFVGPSWSWSYGSWIYNCLCNQWLSPLKLWVWTPFMARCTQYNIMW
jgi:hypothetical protein